MQLSQESKNYVFSAFIPLYFPIINVCSLSCELCQQVRMHQELCYFQIAGPMLCSAAELHSPTVINTLSIYS